MCPQPSRTADRPPAAPSPCSPSARWWPRRSPSPPRPPGPRRPCSPRETRHRLVPGRRRIRPLGGRRRQSHRHPLGQPVERLAMVPGRPRTTSRPQPDRADLGGRVRQGYQIQASDNGTDWRTLKTVTGGDGGTDEVAVSGSGRYVRMLGTERSGGLTGYSLWEFQVYGTTDGTPPATGAVEVTGSQGDWQLTVGGQPYTVKGLTWGPAIADAPKYMPDVKSMGVNTIRTWGTDGGTEPLRRQRRRQRHPGRQRLLAATGRRPRLRWLRRLRHRHHVQEQHAHRVRQVGGGVQEPPGDPHVERRATSRSSACRTATAGLSWRRSATPTPASSTTSPRGSTASTPTTPSPPPTPGPGPGRTTSATRPTSTCTR